MSQKEEQAAGLTPEPEPAQPEVTATRVESVVSPSSADERKPVDFAHLKKQLRIGQVLDHLGWGGKLKGSGAQKRCACPIHRGDGRGRTFSVNVEQDIFQCFDAKCGAKGDVIDLWAALHKQTLREAAADLVRTFHLEARPRSGTEKRNG